MHGTKRFKTSAKTAHGHSYLQITNKMYPLHIVSKQVLLVTKDLRDPYRFLKCVYQVTSVFPEEYKITTELPFPHLQPKLFQRKIIMQKIICIFLNTIFQYSPYSLSICDNISKMSHRNITCHCQIAHSILLTYFQIHNTHTRLTALCPGLPRWAGTRKVKPIWILLKQETVSGSGISWAICKSAPRSRQPCQHPTT